MLGAWLYLFSTTLSYPTWRPSTVWLRPAEIMGSAFHWIQVTMNTMYTMNNEANMSKKDLSIVKETP